MYFVYILSNWSDSVLYIGVTFRDGSMSTAITWLTVFQKNTICKSSYITKQHRMSMLPSRGKSN